MIIFFFSQNRIWQVCLTKLLITCAVSLFVKCRSWNKIPALVSSHHNKFRLTLRKTHLKTLSVSAALCSFVLSWASLPCGHINQGPFPVLRQLWFLQQLPLGSGTSGVKANPLALPPVPACGTSLSRCQAVVCSWEQIETVAQCLVVKKKQKKR